jgi:hypothetical protein
MGKTVFSQTLPHTGSEITIDISALPTGIYVYKAQMPNCGVYTGKISKR